MILFFFGVSRWFVPLVFDWEEAIWLFNIGWKWMNIGSVNAKVACAEFEFQPRARLEATDFRYI